AEDVTYFDPVTAARINGLAAMTEYYRPWTGKIKVDRYEILNPVVVVTDEMAVLSYNLINFVEADGAERPLNRWNSTAVYRRRDNTWQIVHSHWSFIQPSLTNGSVNVNAGLMA